MKRNAAFTLIELIVVIIIAAILAAIAVSRWPGTEINLNAQAQQLASDIRYTQTLAMSRAQDYRLNLTATTYSITTTGGAAINNPVTGNASVALGSGITITLSPTNLPSNLIAFNSLGVPYTNSGATTTLNSAAVITLTSGANTKTITIQPQTGRVTVP
ncbi:MAG TPA: GspH/FimT family pseudopilin [Gammaproteobacteria bacterium]|nr:GspH/FimT family pseudopilin [Gammaproteobacteria bacterium]